MARSAVLDVKIMVDAQDAARGMDQAAQGAKGFTSKVQSMAAPAAAVVGALGLMGKAAVDSASAQEQAFGALDTVFGDSAAAVQSWATAGADSVGLSAAAYGELASVVGAQLGNMGQSQDQAAAGTKGLIEMGADLAATFGGSTADAVSALSSALKGEADPAERYGLNLSAAAVAAEMAADGTDKLTGEAKAAAKAQTIMELATRGAGDAVGAFARESDTAAGSSERAAAAAENASASIGQALLPVVVMVSGALQSFAQWAQQNATLVQVLAGVLLGLAAAVLAVNAAIKVAAAAQAVWNAIMAANPIGLVVLAIAAVVAIVVLLWNKSDGFRNAVIAAWGAIRAAAVAAWNAVGSLITAVVSKAQALLSSAGAFIAGVWRGVQSIATAVWNAIRNVVSAAAAAIGNVVGAMRNAVGNAWNAIQSAASTAWNAITGVVTSVMSGIGGIVSGAAATIKGIWDGIKSAVQGVWDAISGAAASAVAAIQGVLNGILGTVNGIIGAIQSAIGWAKDLLAAIGNTVNKAAEVPNMAGQTMAPPVSSPVGFTAAPSLARAGLLGAPAGTTAAVSTAPTIIIQGALDPDAVARQVSALLRRRDRRAHGPQL